MFVFRGFPGLRFSDVHCVVFSSIQDFKIVSSVTPRNLAIFGTVVVEVALYLVVKEAGIRNTA